METVMTTGEQAPPNSSEVVTETTLYPEVTTEAPAPEGQAVQEEKVEATAETKEPIEYKLELPEETHLLKSDVERVKAFAKEANLSNEAAQKLLEGESTRLKEHNDSLLEQQMERSKQWVEELKKDSSYGGQQFEKSAETAKRVVDRFGDETLKEAFNESGFGNYPPLVKMMVRIGQAMSSDTLVAPNSGPSTQEPKTIEQLFYGNT